MDPLTAFANMVTAICNVISEAMRGQSEAQRRQMWDWFIADQTRLRKLFNVDKDTARVMLQIDGKTIAEAMAPKPTRKARAVQRKRHDVARPHQRA